MRVAFFTRVCSLVTVVALSACGGGGAGGSSGCSPHTATLHFSPIGGYNASGSLTSATACFSSADFLTNTSTGPLLGSAFSPADPTATVLLYLTISFSATEYATGLPDFTIGLPATVPTANRKFLIASNLSGGFSFNWNASVEGPITASGTTLSFSGGGGNTTFSAGQPVEIALYSVAGP